MVYLPHLDNPALARNSSVFRQILVLSLCTHALVLYVATPSANAGLPVPPSRLSLSLVPTSANSSMMESAPPSSERSDLVPGKHSTPLRQATANNQSPHSVKRLETPQNSHVPALRKVITSQGAQPSPARSHPSAKASEHRSHVDAVPAPHSGLKILSAPKPPYPRKARALGFEGSTTLLVSILGDGRVEEAKILESSGRADCDHAALSTVRAKWRFQGMNTNGSDAIASHEKVIISFRLTDSDFPQL